MGVLVYVKRVSLEGNIAEAELVNDYGRLAKGTTIFFSAADVLAEQVVR